MGKTCKYRVDYHMNGDEVARFSNRHHAMIFAKAIQNSEVSDKTGLIAQFDKGKLTPEFEHLDL